MGHWQRALIAAFLLPMAVVGHSIAAENDGRETASSTSPAKNAGHRFQKGEVRTYLSETKQVVTWRSAGDTLQYTTTIALELSCFVEAVSADQVTLVWRTLDLRATHRGPGSDHKLDSAKEEGLNDPLLGDLMVYHLVPLTLVIDPRSGAVQEVRGTEVLVNRLNQRHPAPNPMLPPPRQGAAEKAFDPLRIGTLFSRYLAVPGSGDGRLDLGNAINGHATLSWEGKKFRLGLDAEAESLPSITLHDNPTPLHLQISKLNGEGRSEINAQGVLQQVGGNFTMELTGSAMTQGLSQEHQVTWQLALLRRSLAKASASSSDNSEAPAPLEEP